ncbi:Predicted oxidoreductase [Actinomadura madurae]|uniref:Predicted oxidoreductase n=2 Tax=Actinomadura madurae TaxID=1993 RepID=A0A1I5VAG4_9ACTN|nr:Predicted oxidoreductase [Actinomadura madurae]
MEYMTFGRNTGLRVSEYALGTGNFGTRWGMGAEPATARKIFERFAEAGGTFIDTADTYQAGEAEEIIGDLLDGKRDRFTLATKFANPVTPASGLNSTGNGRAHMVRAVEASLRRLRTDRIDLLWVHFPDAVTPVEEIVRGLDDLVASGKVVHGGLSNFPAWRVSRAVTMADLRGWSPIIAVQHEYSLAERTADREVLPMAEALGLGTALWSPLGGGLLTGKYRSGTEGRLTTWGRVIQKEDSDHKTAIVDELLSVASETGLPPAQVAMAWLRERAARSTTPTVPIIGPRNLDQLDGYLAALDVSLAPEHHDRLTAVSDIALGEPHQANAAQRDALFGGQASAFRTPSLPAA